jgi:Holliday junction DNA helicase RuvA
VFVPLGALGLLPRAPELVTLHVHTQLREDSLTLYGFAQPEDKTAFRTLISVTGIGPKLALAILSSMSASDLADAINREDKARFKGVSGVGKKLVERLVLELKDKLSFVSSPVGRALMVDRPSAQSAFEGSLGVVHGALVSMGYRPSEADVAVTKIKPQAEGKLAQELLREALQVLA